MATFKAVVLAHQARANGSYNVKIRVTHRRKCKYIATAITAFKTDLTKALEIKRNSELMFRCNREIESMVKILSNLGYMTLDRMTVDEVVDYINRGLADQDFHLDFFEFGEEVISGLSAGTSRNYACAFNAFERYLGMRKCDINEITTHMLQKFVIFLRKEPAQIHTRRGIKSTSSMKNGDCCAKRYLALLSRVFNDAKDKYNDEDMGIIRIPRNPFRKVKTDIVIHRSKPILSVEEMQQLISYDGKLTTQQRGALDAFIVSFALMGMNLADMWETKLPKDGVIRYRRKKTRTRRPDGAEFHVRLPDCIAPYVERLSDGRNNLVGMTTRGSDPYLYSSKHARIIKPVTKMIIGKECTATSARKSFATIARYDCGVEKATVDECLNHVSNDIRLADIYIKRDWKHLEVVQDKVLSLFQW